MWFLTLAVLLLAAETLAQKTLIAGNTPERVDGIPILKGDRGNNTYLSRASIHNKLSFTKDPNFNAKLKAGEIDEITFTQEDVDLIARTSPTGHYETYATLPIAKSANTTNGLPKIEEKPGGIDTAAKKNLRRVIEPRSPIWSVDSFFAILPESDAFYFPAIAAVLLNGNAISYRRVDGNFSFPLQASFQMTYRTEDSHGAPNADLTTVLVPQGARTDYFVSYQFHEDSAKLFCANSYVLRMGHPDNPLNSFLENKFPVSLPDYEGPNSIFFGNLRGGRSVINSIRAVKQSLAPFGIQTDKAFLYGYSAAASPTGMAAEMLSSYAPELVGTVNAVALGGYATDVNATFQAVNKGQFAGLIPMLIGSLQREYPIFSTVISTHITAQGALDIPFANSGCSQVMYELLGEDMLGLTTFGEGIFTQPTIMGVFEENSSGKNAPAMDVFFVQSTSDEVAPYSSVQNTVSIYCQGGAKVAWHRTDNEDHETAETHVPEYVPQYFIDYANGASQSAPCTSWADVRLI